MCMYAAICLENYKVDPWLYSDLKYPADRGVTVQLECIVETMPFPPLYSSKLINSTLNIGKRKFNNYYIKDCCNIKNQPV